MESDVATDTMKRQPRFTANSFRTIDDLERRLRTIVLGLLEKRMCEQDREVITDDDIRECYSEAFRELTDRCLSAK
jgi:hypothetical protein